MEGEEGILTSPHTPHAPTFPFRGGPSQRLTLWFWVRCGRHQRAPSGDTLTVTCTEGQWPKGNAECALSSRLWLPRPGSSKVCPHHLNSNPDPTTARLHGRLQREETGEGREAGRGRCSACLRGLTSEPPCLWAAHRCGWTRPQRETPGGPIP